MSNPGKEKSQRSETAGSGRLGLMNAVLLLADDSERTIEEIMEAWSLLIRNKVAWYMGGGWAAYATDLVASGVVTETGEIDYSKIKTINDEEEESHESEEHT